MSQVCDSGRDKLGRWSYITIKGKKNRKVTVISAYRVCDNSIATAGPTTCWKQQWHQLRKRGYQDPNPCCIFLKDFQTFLDQHIYNDEELINGIDANETDKAGTDLHAFLLENNLVDAVCHLHPEVTPPNTYQHSNN
eukprot:3319269-Ditylum_brightwellii.AAC.1